MSYTSADLVVAQRFANAKFADPEKRKEESVVFPLFVASNKLLELSFDRNREDTPPTEAHYMTANVRALLTTARSHDHTGTQGDSDTLTPTWITRKAVWSETMKLPDNKMWSAQDILNNEVYDAFVSFEEGKETLAVDHLFTNRTQVNSATLEGSFDGVNYYFDIDEATNGNRKAQITETVMSNNKYGKYPLIYICDTVAFNKFRFDAAQGAQNNTNLSFQYNGIQYMHSKELDTKSVALSITKGLWCVVPFGTIGVADWIPMQNTEGRDFGNEGKYSTMINPFDNLSYAHHLYFNKLDGTSVDGYTQDIKFEHELSIDLAFENAPLSVANESTIFFFVLT